MGKFLYKTEYQWENEMKIITQSCVKEEEALRKSERVTVHLQNI